MQPLSLIKPFLQQASEQGSRSTVLRPLSWMLSICLAATIAMVGVHAPTWLLVLFAVFSAATAAIYLGSYIFCLKRDRDALRSETYSIQRLAIEKGFVGDSASGLFKADSIMDRPLLGHSDKAAEGSER